MRQQQNKLCWIHEDDSVCHAAKNLNCTVTARKNRSRHLVHTPNPEYFPEEAARQWSSFLLKGTLKMPLSKELWMLLFTLNRYILFYLQLWAGSRPKCDSAPSLAGLSFYRVKHGSENEIKRLFLQMTAYVKMIKQRKRCFVCEGLQIQTLSILEKQPKIPQTGCRRSN